MVPGVFEKLLQFAHKVFVIMSKRYWFTLKLNFSQRNIQICMFEFKIFA